MKSEKRRALTFIVVGCIGALALGFFVWLASSPDRPTLDIAMHTTPSTTPAPALFENPGGGTDLPPAPERTQKPLAAVDTADPYLPPNAYVPPRTQVNPAESSATSPQAVGTVGQTAPGTTAAAPAQTPSQDGADPTTSADPTRSDTPGDSATRTPEPPLPDLPTVPPTTPPQTTEDTPTTDDEEDTPTTDDEEDTVSLFPVEPTPEPTAPDQTTSGAQTEDTDQSTPPAEPTPTDFVDEPTAPLNPETPTDPAPES